MRKITITLLAALAMFATPAKAMSVNGNKLLMLCEAEHEDEGSYYLCLGYITAIADLTHVLTEKGVTLFDADGAEATAGFYWCRPKGVTNAELVDVVVHELRAHPEDRHASALPLIIRALRTSFPCY